MQIQAETRPLQDVSVDALAVICFESNEEKKPEPSALAEPASDDPPVVAQSGWMSELRKTGEFTGKLYDFAILHRPEGLTAKRLVVIGGGKRDKFSTVEVRRAAGVLVRALKSKGVRSIALVLETVDTAAAAAVEGALIGGWEPDKYKTDPKKSERQIDVFSVVVVGGDTDALTKAVRLGQVVGEAHNQARDLANEPANRLKPADLADAAKEMAAKQGLTIEVLDQAAMADLGMGALLGVAQGSSNPPFLISLQYRPSMVQGTDHLALIGKGVTFDTGGISIKPADGMEKMKYDMSGAAAVIGAMSAIAQLKPSIPVTGYIPTVENMLNGDAQRPGDIVKTMSGKTVEVLNTDAEGRLILADAITYAKKNGATHLVDAATLTGAIGIALGHYNVGAFTNDEGLLNRVLDAAKFAGEKTWQLPMDDEYKEYLKSVYADLPNIGGRYGGSITAAWFLREFADPTPWVHLDIASTAWSDDGKAWLSKGPTGVTVRSFITLALHWSQSNTNPSK